MKKRCQVIFLIILVSFFISCGIPNYFFLEDSDYIFSSSKESETKFETSLSINDQEELNKLEEGLGMVYFYYISTDSTNTTKFISEFSTKFRGSIGLGIIGAPNDLENGPVISYSTEGESNKYDLYVLTTSLSNPEPPDYHELIVLDSTISFDSTFELKTEIDGTKYISYSNTNNDINFLRSNQSGFVPFSEEIDSDTDLDYSQISSTNAPIYYIHIFSSFTAQEGNFTNRWWSKLEYLGSLKIS